MALAALALLAFSATTHAALREGAGQPQAQACEKKFHQPKAVNYARGLYLRHDKIKPRSRDHLNTMLSCLHTADAQRNVKRKVERFRDARESRKRAERIARQQYLSVKQTLDGIAACESGGNIRAIGGGGAYRGKYQFSFGTWASVGGSGDPAQASEAEQDMRAAKLLKTGGIGHWPVCGAGRR